MPCKIDKNMEMSKKVEVVKNNVPLLRQITIEQKNWK